MCNPKLSVCCITYNHAKYLRRAIDSVLNQVVDFNFEIIIGDDFSTDGSREILKNYEHRYPGLIRLILQTSNTGGRKNFHDVYSAATGEYVIALETDDFWIDSNKLKIQVDFLNQHPECIAVAHNCMMVDENSHRIDKSYPAIKSGWYTYKHFRSCLMPGQTTTMMYRNILLDKKIDKSLWYSQVPGPGDIKKIFTFLVYGKIYTLPLCMSAYRYVVSGGSSFSANHKRNEIDTINYYFEFRKFAQKYNKEQLLLSAEVRLLQSVLSAFVRRKIGLRYLLSSITSCKQPLLTLFYSMVNIIKFKLS